jgi:hypothetical protein
LAEIALLRFLSAETMALCADAVTTAGVTGGDVGGGGVDVVDVVEVEEVEKVVDAEVVDVDVDEVDVVDVGATGAGGGGVGVESVDVVWAGVVLVPCWAPGSWLTPGEPLDGATGGSLLMHAFTARWINRGSLLKSPVCRYGTISLISSSAAVRVCSWPARWV